MPKAWSKKDEKQYQAIRHQQLDRGRDEDTAEEIAARTVNKQRRKEGRTSGGPSSATGNPNTPLEDRTKKELYNRARELDIEGRSRMNKDELIRAVRKRNH